MLNEVTQTDYSRKLLLEKSCLTHTGNVRSVNEDSVLCHKHYPLFVIADGMGGHSAGDKASQFIIKQLSQLQLNGGDLPSRIEKISHTISRINNDINNNPWVNDPSIIVGSTLLAVYIEKDICTCFWVGDSRLYIYRDSRLYQITRDHSLVQEMLDKGLLTHEEAAQHPQNNVLTRALGVEQEVKIDINQFSLQPGDRLLLCSDGLYNEVDDQQLIESLNLPVTEQAAEQLLEQVLAGTAADNVSLIVITKK